MSVGYLEVIGAAGAIHSELLTYPRPDTISRWLCQLISKASGIKDKVPPFLFKAHFRGVSVSWVVSLQASVVQVHKAAI